MVDARRHRVGRDEALVLLGEAATLRVAKAGRVLSVDLRSGGPDDDALAAMVLGPTGNLRAPTIRVGSTVIVGFDERMYADALGG